MECLGAEQWRSTPRRRVARAGGGEYQYGGLFDCLHAVRKVLNNFGAGAGMRAGKQREGEEHMRI